MIDHLKGVNKLMNSVNDQMNTAMKLQRVAHQQKKHLVHAHLRLWPKNDQENRVLALRQMMRMTIYQWVARSLLELHKQNNSNTTT